MLMNVLLLGILLLLAVQEGVAVAKDGDIWDPFDVFCGKRDCYSVLGVDRSANSTVISKAYRKLSRAAHPDKIRGDAEVKAKATEAFRVLAKANEVLQGNESRPNFDFYLDNGPRSYYKVTGKHMWKALPKAPVWFVLLVALGLASWFVHVVQNGKHERAKRILRLQISQGLSKAQGGTEITVNLAAKSYKEFERQLRDSKEPADKARLKQFLSSQGRARMSDDAEFLKVVDSHIDGIQDWGAYYKPRREHLLIVRFFYLPMTLLSAWKKYHRRYISTEPLAYEEREEMCMDMVGWTLWDSLTAEERKEAVELEVWRSKAYDKWNEDRENKFVNSKKYKKMVKRGYDRDYDE